MFAAGLVVAGAATAQTPAPVYVPAQVMGGGDPFFVPFSVATDPLGNIIVADTYHQLVKVYEPTGVTMIASYGTPGDPHITNSTPYPGLPGGDCANYGAYDPVTLLPVLNPIPRSDCFSFPSGVATDSVGRIYVVDAGNRRIMLFDTAARAVGGQLRLLSTFGTLGGLIPDSSLTLTQTPMKDGDFSSPIDIAIDRVAIDSSPARVKDRVYVLDANNNRITAFDLDPVALQGGVYEFKFATKFPTPLAGQTTTLGTLPAQFSFPQGFGVDQTTGNIAVADTGNQRLQVFQYPFTGTNSGLIPALQIGATTTVTDPTTGLVVKYPVAGGGYGTARVGGFSSPNDAAIDSQHRVWVVDADWNRVQVFNPDGTSAFVLSGTPALGLDFPEGIELDETHQRVIIASSYSTVQIWKPAALGVAVSPLAAGPTALSTVTATVTVTNTGTVPLTQVQPNVVFSNPDIAYVAPGNLPAPLTTVLDVNMSATFSIPITLSSTGPVTVTVTATGVHALSQIAITSPPAGVSTTVQPALTAAVSVLPLAISPSPVLVGKSITLTVRVKNTGNAALNNVTAGISLTGPVTGPATATVATLAAGATKTWLLTYTAGSIAGTAGFSVSATATNAVTGTAVLSATSQSASVAVQSDVTAPTTSIAITPAPNANGYWNHGASATLTAADNTGGSGVARICYQYAVLNARVNQCATPGTPGPTFSVTLQDVARSDLEQIVTITYHAEDAAGNIEASKTFDVLADGNPPVAQFDVPLPASPSVAPDGTRWNKTSVTVPFHSVDGLSGVASVSFGGSPVNLNQQQIAFGIEGKGIRGAVVVTDAAGNSATYLSPSVSIDKTPPTITTAISSASAPNAQGVYSTPVTVTFTGITDPDPPALTASGVTVDAYVASGINPATSPPAGITVAASGKSVVGWTVCDYAGNCTTATVTVNLSLTSATPTSGPVFLSVPSPTLTTSLINNNTVAMPDLMLQVVVSAVNNPVVVTQSIAPNTPLAPGTYTLIFTAVDSKNLSTSTAVTVTVISPVPARTCTADTVKFEMHDTPAGSVLWLNSVFRLQGKANPAVYSHLYVTGAVVVIGGRTVKLPDAAITFAPAGSTPYAVASGGMWLISVPLDFKEEAFLTGALYPMPAAITQTTATTVQACFSTDVPGFSIEWQAAAAAYPASIGLNLNALRVKVLENDPRYPRSDPAGTPEAVKGSVIKGGSGKGGANYTGGSSNTGHVTPPRR